MVEPRRSGPVPPHLPARSCSAPSSPPSPSSPPPCWRRASDRPRRRSHPTSAASSRRSRRPPRFPVRFYLVAMIFIIFDIEIVFLYPWAVDFHQLGVFGLVEVLVFAVVVFVAFLYLVSNGALSWGPVAPAGAGDAGPHLGVDDHPHHRGPGVPGPGRLGAGRGPRGPPAQLPDRPGRGPGEVGPAQQRVAGHLRPGLLRHRDDVGGRRRLRHQPPRHGGVPGLAPPGRPHDRGRPGLPEDGPGAPTGLRPDDGAQVGHLDGRVRLHRRDVQQLRHRPGGRPDRPRRRLRTGVPPLSRDAAARHPDPAREDPDRRDHPAAGPRGRRRAHHGVRSRGGRRRPVRVATPR